MLTSAKPYIIGKKSAKRSKLRVNDAAGVIGSPLSMTTFSPSARLPGVAAQRAQLEDDGIQPFQREEQYQRECDPQAADRYGGKTDQVQNR